MLPLARRRPAHWRGGRVETPRETSYNACVWLCHCCIIPLWQTHPIRTAKPACLASAASGGAAINPVSSPSFIPSLRSGYASGIAAGATLDEACAVPGSPHPTTFRRWAMEDRRLGDLYRKAARLASVAHRDRAAILARKLEAGEIPHGRIMATKAAVRSYMQLARA